MSHLHESSGARGCDIQESGAVELYFYEELDAAERDRIAAHVRHCPPCAAVLEDLAMIRAVLAGRPDVAAPPTGDWSGFMARLDAAIANEARTHASPRGPNASAFGSRAAGVRSYIGLLATAALLVLVTIGVVSVARQRTVQPHAMDVALTPPSASAAPVATSGLRSAGERHFDRSKLVVLGLAGRETGEASPSDWAYERELASSLLNDTRLYRMAAEERGLDGLASVMRDLEIVLLETSMAQDTDTEALGQIQRLIRKRGLIQKMDTVASAGM